MCIRDSLSGMGIELALESAELGADAVLEAMYSNRKAVNSNAALAEYDAAMRAHAQEHDKAAAFHYGRQESRSAGPSVD